MCAFCDAGSTTANVCDEQACTLDN
jgi:hypothetical protein